MLRQKGIVRRTFLFSLLLIFLVTVASFAVLYFTLPGFYRVKKEQTLRNNTASLTASLREAADVEASAALLADFSLENNANVVSVDAQGNLLPTLSTPFLTMTTAPGGEASAAEQNIVFSVRAAEVGRSEYTLIIMEPGPDMAGLAEGGQARQTQMQYRVGISGGGDTISLTGKVKGALVDSIIVTGTLQPVDEAAGVLLSLAPYVLAIGLVLGFVLSGVYARKISKPVLQISQAAVRMQRLEADVLSGVRSADELGELSCNLDKMYVALRENINELQRERDKAARLEQSKTEMMQSAGHELKTPLTALGGVLEGMIDNIGPYRERDRYLRECRTLTDKMSVLVEEILDATKADTVKAAEVEQIDVAAVMEQVIEGYEGQIAEKSLRLEKDLSAVAVELPPELFFRVLSNLMSNAVRYTAPGGWIRVSLDDPEEQAALCVENQCDPIPEEELDKLFEPFYTRSYSRNRDASGTGLGLYIVKRNLERLGLGWEARSTGEGFLFRICLTQPERAAGA